MSSALPVSTGRSTTTRAPVLHAIQIDAVHKLASDDGGRRLSCWLTARERETYAGLRVPKRRKEWLAGRIAAKEAIRRRHELPGGNAFLRIEILTVASGPERGRPHYLVDRSSAASFGLSISHSGDVALAALSRRRGERIGVDAEHPVEAGAGFESLLLSSCERRSLERVAGTERQRALTRLWVLKEAFAKALGVGLRLPLPAIRVAGGTDAPALLVSPEVRAGVGEHRVEASVFERDGLWIAWVAVAQEPRES